MVDVLVGEEIDVAVGLTLHVGCVVSPCESLDATEMVPSDIDIISFALGQDSQTTVGFPLFVSIGMKE